MTAIDDFVYQAVENGDMEIDSQGRIWKLARRMFFKRTGQTKIYRCRRHRAENFAGRYLTVTLTFAGEKHLTPAHRLVWRHFNGPISEGKTINHKDGKKKNNKPNNLEPMTQSEQLIHAVRVLGWDPSKNVRGAQIGALNGRAKLKTRHVEKIARSSATCKELAARYGVSIAAISKVRTGRTWKAAACV